MTLFVTCVYKRLTNSKKLCEIGNGIAISSKEVMLWVRSSFKVMTDLKLLIQLPGKHMNVFHTIESSSS